MLTFGKLEVKVFGSFVSFTFETLKIGKLQLLFMIVDVWNDDLLIF